MDNAVMILWLDRITADGRALVGGKAANLGEMLRAGFSIPPGFCITTAAYRVHILRHGLEPQLEALAQGHGESADPAAVFHRPLDPILESELLAAGCRLLGASPEIGRLVVRSSATMEDLHDASFAGQGESYLDVTVDQLPDRLRDCWASLWSPRAIAYRGRLAADNAPPEMAVIVQLMVPSDVGGVAFSVDPLGSDAVIIEAAPGLAQTVVQGAGEITRYAVERMMLAYHRQGKAILNTAQVTRIAEEALALENHFGGPQDVEWGLWKGDLFLFQCRPVTAHAAAERFFTQPIPSDDYLWTGGYLNERFPRPVSPLGWSVVGDLTEELAFRDPLRYLGYPGVAELPLTKLYRGHPYTNVAVFQIFYKVFPRSLLPDDAVRYFPGGDTGLRAAAPYPCCLLDPRLIISMLCHFVRDPGNWSPLHNHRHWARFALRLDRAVDALATRLGIASSLLDFWAVATSAQRWNRELLGIHRWSLMAADLFVSSLRRLVGRWAGSERQAELTGRLLSGLPNKTLELDQALRRLRPQSDSERPDMAQFLVEYGHRSFSLDLWAPTFADDPEQVNLLMQIAGTEPDVADRAAVRRSAEKELRTVVGTRPLGRLKLAILDQLLGFARRYVILREDQRFAWQRLLALQRRAFLHLGQLLAERGFLARADDIFFATMTEVSGLVESEAPPRDPDTYSSRRAVFTRLQHEFDLAPHLTYPAFLRGNQPLESWSDREAHRWQGVPVSPGLVRGPVCVVRTPSDLGRITPGDILVALSTDPGWTPVFGRLAGLILERGGQLSHGSVVAREYGLPAVVGVPRVTELLHDGDQVLLDGSTGIVVLEGVAPGSNVGTGA